MIKVKVIKDNRMYGEAAMGPLNTAIRSSIQIATKELFQRGSPCYDEDIKINSSDKRAVGKGPAVQIDVSISRILGEHPPKVLKSIRIVLEEMLDSAFAAVNPGHGRGKLVQVSVGLAD